MANVIVTIREYKVLSPLTLSVVSEKTSIFRRFSSDDDIKTVEIKENDVVYRINNSFYLGQKNYEYILLDVKEEFIHNNPKIFELKVKEEAEVKK
jgi:hypothetical protein